MLAFNTTLFILPQSNSSLFSCSAKLREGKGRERKGTWKLKIPNPYALRILEFDYIGMNSLGGPPTKHLVEYYKELGPYHPHAFHFQYGASAI